MVTSGSLAGAVITTFLAPAVRCLEDVARSRRRPVDPPTPPTPSSFHGSAAGSFTEQTRTSLPSTKIESPLATTSAASAPWTESCFSRWPSVLASARSLTATTSSSLVPRVARKNTRPIRPKPLTPTRTPMWRLLLLRREGCVATGEDIISGRQRDRQWPQGTRARVRTPTALAPASSNTRAHSATVAPVVKTSSISSTCRPATAADRDSVKAPRTLARRRSASKSVCDSVGRRRRRALRSTGPPHRRPTRFARSTDWLNPRSASRDGCRGTSTRQSTAPTASMAEPASAKRSPSGGAHPFRRGRESGLGGVPASAAGAAVLPAGVGEAAGRALVRPLEALRQREGTPVFLEGVGALSPALEDRAEVGVQWGEIRGPDLHLLKLLGGLVEHFQCEVHSRPGEP